MTSDEQLQLWLKGESKCPNDSGECCPDFSCCRPDLLLPLAERQRFVSDPSSRDEIMFGALGKVLAGKNCELVRMSDEIEPCELCGESAALRPYGPGGKKICFECGKRDPHGTERRIAEAMGATPAELAKLEEPSRSC